MGGGDYRAESFADVEDAVISIEPRLMEGLFGMGPLQEHVDCVSAPKRPAAAEPPPPVRGTAP